MKYNPFKLAWRMTCAIWRRFKPSIDTTDWPPRLRFGPREPIVPFETFVERVVECSDCPFRDVDRCFYCGCYLRPKASLSTETCPEGRWPVKSELVPEQF
jgi:hypothetical protein